MSDPRRDEMLWCAGFWDGEGCTSYQKQYRPYGEYLYPILSISQTDREVLDRFKAAVGFGSIHPRPGKGSTKPYHVFRAGGLKPATIFFNAVFPFLSSIKQAQFLRVWTDCREFKLRRECPAA